MIVPAVAAGKKKKEHSRGATIGSRAPKACTHTHTHTSTHTHTQAMKPFYSQRRPDCSHVNPPAGVQTGRTAKEEEKEK